MSEEIGQCAHFLGEQDRDPLRSAVIGHLDEHREPGGALDEGGDLGTPTTADDQVALPEAGHGPVGGLGRALADVDHADDGSPAHRGAGARHPAGAALAQRKSELGAQLAPGLQVQRLVDRLVRHPPSVILGVVGAQPLGHLPRRPPLSQPVVDGVVQFPVRFQHTLLRPRPPRVRAILGGHRPIRTPPTIAGDLPRHHRMISVKQNTDPPTRQPGRNVPGNQLPLLGYQFNAAHSTPLKTVDHVNSHAIAPFSRWCTHPMTLRTKDSVFSQRATNTART